MAMSVKTYFDKELATAIAFALIGIVVGYASFLANSPLQSFFIMLIVGVAFYLALQKTAKIKEDKKWWISNAFIIYVFLWLVTWTVFYNVGIR